ncbi:DNA replication endonuclease-helicase Dna2 [Collariella sp. IMI 366227]|nr:DNA replication endonuclease-helicase Dna2 [Collariella sp. IMI 366227]
MPLQKSLSEQNGGFKTHPVSQTTAPPPLPVSAKTKSKLQTFEFEPTPEKKPKHTSPAPDAVSSAVTPAGRNTWRDLLLKAEAPRDDEHQSPSERILWRNDLDANQPVAMSPLLPRKGRKRARSSSPISSPASRILTPNVDVKKLARVLKTPRADPASELWDRFSVPGTNTSPSGLMNPLLAQLMVSSSPRPKDGSVLGSERPLRKAISCDDDFDDETLLELDASFLGQTDDRTLVVSAGNSSQTAAPVPVKKAVDDEFGDLDDDFFEEAEDLVAQVEAKHMSQTTTLQGHWQDTPAKVVEEDEFGDLDDIDFDEVELAATQAAASRSFSSNPSQKPKAIQRYLVTEVLESSYTNERDWYETHIGERGEKKDRTFVHIIGDFEPSGRCVIDNNHNILILHPDQLISSTVVADSFTCLRRAVLQDRVKTTSEATPALVYGTVLHEVFQEAMMANNWDLGFLGIVISKTLQKHLEDLYIIKVSMDDAKAHVLSKMPELQSWAQAFVTATPKPNAFVQGKNGERLNMCVSKLLDVEEHVWSPMYGLKGNIDATVQVTMREGKASRTLTVPFEVKTGKNATANHQAQTVLYNLLLSDRYDIEIVYGILYYMETSSTLRIPAIRHELRHMIMQRNTLAGYIRERSVTLPPMKRSKNACGRCYAQASCFTYHKLADGGDGKTSGLGEKFEELVKHLSPTHQEFFLRWEDLLTKEEKESQKLRRELWTMLSTEREKLGRCFSNVIIEEGSASEDKHTAKINRFSYNFVKEKSVVGFSFLDSQLTVGEPIVVSDEQGHFALALGYVTAVKKQRISVAVDRRLHNARIRQPGFDEVSNQVFASIMEVAPEGAKPEQSQGKIKEAPIRYRVDKDEFSNGMATVRNNLVQAMAASQTGSADIRRLVVDLEPPRFKATPTQYTVPGKDNLNVDQKAAVEKVMSARDYALVLGMPGTGKTTTIAHIIRALIGQGKTLLLTSYTHTAVDNILLKLKNDNIPILRLGAPAKVHPEVQDFVALAGQSKSSFEEIRHAWHDTPVVATTCLGINHPIFNERTFDYCIVDEASQITLPICLGPIRMARTFVLVGDHNQLPPLVQNQEAREGGLDISLFKLLSDTHPQSVVNLEHQYRMCEDIMTLSNTLIYSGRLKCGTEALRHAKLHIPYPDALRTHHFNPNPFSPAPRRVVAKAPRKGLLFPPAGGNAIKGKENQPLSQDHGQRTVEPKKVARIGERAMLKGKPVLRDILNDMMDGGY